MDELKRGQCQPCEGGVEPLGREQALAELEALPGWQLDDDGRSIVRDFRFEDFQATMAFVNALAAMAEAQGHHPDFCAGYGYCKVRYTTHAIGGLSNNDLICAALASELTES
ncbi:MAG: 4a-hydroxytetrahydrobiopterin dehydratase [Lysobacterales bacterium]